MGKLWNSSLSWDSLKGIIYKGGGGPENNTTFEIAALPHRSLEHLHTS